VEARGPDHVLRFVWGPFCTFLDLVVIPLFLRSLCVKCTEVVIIKQFPNPSKPVSVQKKKQLLPHQDQAWVL
jgi:hypothetical protein